MKLVVSLSIQAPPFIGDDTQGLKRRSDPLTAPSIIYGYVRRAAREGSGKSEYWKQVEFARTLVNVDNKADDASTPGLRRKSSLQKANSFYGI